MLNVGEVNLENLLYMILPPSTLSIISFTSRWQYLRSKLGTLKSILSEISDSSYWADNPLQGTLLPDLLLTLHRVEILCNQCSDPSFTVGKLLMQSNLDMASGWLSKQTRDFKLLIRSGDLFTRLKIGVLEFKRKALDSLIQLLSEDENSGCVVAKEVNLNCLIHLLDPIYPTSVRDLAVVAVSMLDLVMAFGGDLNSASDKEDATFNDSDYSLGEEDDILFEENVTHNIELDMRNEIVSLEAAYKSENSEYAPSDDLRSVHSDSDEDVVTYPEFNGDVDMVDPVLEVGLKFRSKKERFVYLQPTTVDAGIEQGAARHFLSQPKPRPGGSGSSNSTPTLSEAWNNL
ncbi:unnamed protein product [Fraxinus pennsylvanica]|uniref:DUF7032 domain-containing protein n=1 Tax=Fraxinus pennsylvanica TaxID=56036 RepID=A0AAD2AHC0_9LAMI|nr:unnamed protein product [Fraxinus pennsylvanica]